MEALSSSVSTLKLSCFSSAARDQYHHHHRRRHHHHLLRPSTTYIQHPQPQISNQLSSTLSLAFELHLSAESNTNTTQHHFLPPSRGSPIKPSTFFHQTAASGYAAALLDVARFNKCVDEVAKDVRRIVKLLQDDVLQVFMADSTVEIEKKGRVLEEVALKVGSTKHVVWLVKMLVGKGKMELVSRVLEEFKRMYDEWCGMRLVLVCSKEKMGKEQLKGIAKDVQMSSGATKVKVRHVVDSKFPSFVM